MAKRKPRRKPANCKTKRDSSADLWVKRTLSKMSLAEKLGQLLMVPFHGRLSGPGGKESRELQRFVGKLRVGGFMLHTRMTPRGLEKGEIEATVSIINRLQGSAKTPLLVAADFERGTAMRLEGGTSFPHAMGVAATGTPEDAYEVGRITALEARAVGIHWIFAPVCDVNSNPENPIVNTRSYGEVPERVAEFAAAFVRGVEENGGFATAKHFPGHGDTSTDSHLDLPRIGADRARLEKVELVPFRAAMDAGVASVMTGHLAVATLDPDPNVPATLSQRILTGLLRGEMGFRGLAVTDAMDMAGVATKYSPGEAAVRAILAGADVVLLSPSPEKALKGLREAVASRRLPIARVDEAVSGILRAKVKLGLHKDTSASQWILGFENTGGQGKFAATAQDIADRGVTLLRDVHGILPINAARPLRVLLVSIDADPDLKPGETFEREIRWRVDSLQAIHVDVKFAPAAKAMLPVAEDYDIAIAALFVRVADRKGDIGLPPEQVALVERLLAQNKPVVVVCFGSPYVIERFPNAYAWLAAFSTADVAQRAAARALFGQTAIGGKLPVGIPGATPPLKLDDGIIRDAVPMKLRRAPEDTSTLRASVWTLLDQAVKECAFPGGTIAIGHKNEMWLHAFGRQSYEKRSPITVPDTIYDVASLTKPVVTTTLIAMEVEAGRLDLDTGLGTYLPKWEIGKQKDWRKRVTLRHLLTHTSGLPGKVHYYETLKTKTQVIEHAICEKLIYEPGSRVEYSDPGFILLGEILERLTGRRLNELAQARIFAPLGMHATLWTPLGTLHKRIAPTGTDSPLRKRLLKGVVHDDNAWVMGGVAGHAGLFSTAGDLAVFCQMMLNGGIYAHQRFLRRATIEQFTMAQPLAGNTRALGWVVRTEPSASGRYLSERSYGHSGFTGTSMWIDPEKDLFVVLLSNRVHPTRDNEKIQEYRPVIHDAVVEALGLQKPQEEAPGD